MRDRLIELLKKEQEARCRYTREKIQEMLQENLRECLRTGFEFSADYLLANGVIVPPCKVGDKVYYVSESPLNLSVQANTIYEADVSRVITTRYGTTLVIQIHNSYGCTEIPDVNDFGKTVFLTKEEAEQTLKGGEG